MKILYARCEGTFDVIPVGGGRRKTARPVDYLWAVEQDGVVRYERLSIEGGYNFDGTSRPGAVGWLVPRWGAGALASCFHDRCFTRRPFLSTGERISRKEADLVFLALWPIPPVPEMRATTVREYVKAVVARCRAAAARATAQVVYRAVRLFGEPVLDAHDSEFRKDPARE